MKTPSLRSILVSLNDVAQLPSLLVATRHLAGKFNAQVKGLYVIPAVQVYPMMGYDAVPETYDGNQLFFKKSRDKVKADFEAAMKADGLEYAFHEVQGRSPQIAMEVAEQGRAHDIVLLAASQAEGASGFEDDLAERVVMLAGRPVLVLPRNAGTTFDFSEVLLGWDAGREAARATFDAMPILRQARRVRIVGIDVAPRGLEPGAEIAETLAHHGVKAEITHVSSDGMNAGATLLRAAKDHGAGLVGKVEVNRNNNRFAIGPHAFIGELAFLREKPATATTFGSAGSLIVSWEQDALRNLMKSDEGVRKVLGNLLSADMAEKIAKSAAPLLQEQDT